MERILSSSLQYPEPMPSSSRGPKKVSVEMNSSLPSHASSGWDWYSGGVSEPPSVWPHELFLLFTDLWTSWALLVTDGPMESPLGPQPIRLCSCSQKATSPCRSRSGPKVPGLAHYVGNLMVGIRAVRDSVVGVRWDRGELGELGVPLSLLLVQPQSWSMGLSPSSIQIPFRHSRAKAPSRGTTTHPENLSCDIAMADTPS